ncbi:hypothetical protein YWIDRAFT_01021 [Streptomyces sp. SceaMP-e96]|uniref:hypothetical protein n=1 Tax=Streptomyces TaxID=1883 RepID=UPI000823AAA7|nr:MULTISPECIES: hypothetical protein [unclassified Streptomyces]SCK12203.1 hypothetical protein YWIDRAFT_01021 [Streptomyces sp. SceaMP-e96]
MPNAAARVFVRLLPWTSPDGKPCFLAGDGSGYVSRVADRIEEEQLSSADDLIDEARQMLAARAWTPGELHLLAVELTASLTEVRRVARSRGGRLSAALGHDVPDDAEGEGPRLAAEAFGCGGGLCTESGAV